MDRKKVLVLGGSGMLGSMVALVLSSNPKFEVSATYRNEVSLEKKPKNIKWFRLDSSNTTLPELEQIVSSFDYVINGLGYIKQRKPHDFQFLSSEIFSSNTFLPLMLDYLSKRKSFKLIQIGTDCVFDGSKGFYFEDSEMTPIGDYGLSKAAVESKLENSLVIRCSIIGPEFRNKLSLLEWFLSQPSGAIIKGYTNHFWNGVTTLHFAKVVQGCMEFGNDSKGIFHLVPDDYLSKFDLLVLFREIFERMDVEILSFENDISVNRVLMTKHRTENLKFWSNAGFSEPPKIQKLVEECRGFLANYRRNFS